MERAVGHRIEAVGRRGKFLLLPLAPRSGSATLELVLHLGMTGVLAPRPLPHLRLLLRLSGGEPSMLYIGDARRFGRYLVVDRGDYATLPTLAAMGPEPLEAGFTVAGFAAALAASRAPIKALLLSQRPVSGVGNIYADEALWRARVHPASPAAALSASKIRALYRSIREVLAAAVEHQGTTLYDYRTVNGEVGAYLEKLDAYGHDGDPCRRCGRPLVKVVLAQRGTHYCPRCQRRASLRRARRA